MKTLLTVSVAFVFCGLIAGCIEQTPGGPGATKPHVAPGSTTANRPNYESDNTFTIGVPVLSTAVKQGQTESATLSLNRGRNFDQDVAIELSGLPQGVTAEPVKPMIKHGDKETTVQIHAANDAALGDFIVKVTGRPATGAEATSELKLTVKENK